ncbi:hypothetical protein PABG_11971 [Paracoccidioides brasiliensis Pb03]|nr:hypothetical protein PABG_11971 [Paracoccidioides brasiliensis Pb03]
MSISRICALQQFYSSAKHVDTDFRGTVLAGRVSRAFAAVFADDGNSGSGISNEILSSEMPSRAFSIE